MPRTDPTSATPDADPGAAPPGSPAPPALVQILEEARTAGFLGPGPIDVHLRHAEGFVAVCRRLWPDGATPPVLLDLGSGGGLPGLVVATRRPDSTLVLLDAQARRTAFLSDAVRRLGLEARVSVRQARAEVAGRDPDLRGHFDGVLARSFGRPAVVAECGSPLLRLAGWLVVSEPPRDASDAAAPPSSSAPSPATPGSALPLTGRPDTPGDSSGKIRWPAEPLRQFGLRADELVREEFDYQTLRQEELCPDRFPRRDGMPAKRPLF